MIEPFFIYWLFLIGCGVVVSIVNADEVQKLRWWRRFRRCRWNVSVDDYYNQRRPSVPEDNATVPNNERSNQAEENGIIESFLMHAMLPYSKCLREDDFVRNPLEYEKEQSSDDAKHTNENMLYERVDTSLNRPSEKVDVETCTCVNETYNLNDHEESKAKSRVPYSAGLENQNCHNADGDENLCLCIAAFEKDNHIDWEQGSQNISGSKSEVRCNDSDQTRESFGCKDGIRLDQLSPTDDVIVMVESINTADLSTNSGMLNGCASDNYNTCDQRVDLHSNDIVNYSLFESILDESDFKLIRIPIPGQTVQEVDVEFGVEQRSVLAGCPICLGELVVDERVNWSSNERCTHIFHEACILEWLNRWGRNNLKNLRRKSTSMQELSTDEILKEVTQMSWLCPVCRQDFIKQRSVKSEEDIVLMFSSTDRITIVSNEQ